MGNILPCNHGKDLQQCFKLAKANQGNFDDACIVNLESFITSIYRKYSMSISYQEADIQDLTQDFIIKIIQEILPKYEIIIAAKTTENQPVSDYLRNYLFTAARHFCIDIYRKNQKHSKIQSFSDEMTETVQDKRAISADMTLEEKEKLQEKERNVKAILDCVEQLRTLKKGKMSKQSELIYHVTLLYNRNSQEIEKETGVKPRTQYKYIEMAIPAIYTCLQKKGMELPSWDEEMKKNIKKMLDILAKINQENKGNE